MIRKLDWKSSHDDRSLNYGIRPAIKSSTVPVRKMWDEGVILDQGNEGACVGFGWVGEYLAQPVAPEPQPGAQAANAYAFSVYEDAKQVDEIPGEDYEGTSVLAGAKVMKSRGFIAGYKWCFGIEDVRDAIIQEGPVVIGIPWKNGMYETGSDGVVKVSGKLVGGHCLVLTGYDPAFQIGRRKYEVFRWRNSWGAGYGVNGSGYIKATDLAKLLRGVGEACVPIGRKSQMLSLPAPAINKVSFWQTLKERVLIFFGR